MNRPGATDRPAYRTLDPSRASMRHLLKLLRRGRATSTVMRVGGITGLEHRTLRKNLVPMLKDGVLGPASKRRGQVTAIRRTLDESLGTYGFNRVFLSTNAVGQAGGDLFPVGPKDAKRIGRPPEVLDQVLLELSLDAVDHPTALGLSHMTPGWTYGERTVGSTTVRNRPGLAAFIHAAAAGGQTELVFKKSIDLRKYLKRIIVPPEQLEAVKADLRANGIQLWPGVELVAAKTRPGESVAARRWLSRRPTRVTKTRDGYIMAEDL